MPNVFSNASTGLAAVSPEDYLPAPADATHFDTCNMTTFHWHKQIDGQWAYFNEDNGSWKVYNNQQAATVEDFIEI